MVLKPGQDVGDIICASVLLYVCAENTQLQYVYKSPSPLNTRMAAVKHGLFFSNSHT